MTIHIFSSSAVTFRFLKIRNSQLWPFKKVKHAHSAESVEKFRSFGLACMYNVTSEFTHPLNVGHELLYIHFIIIVPKCTVVSPLSVKNKSRSVIITVHNKE